MFVLKIEKNYKNKNKFEISFFLKKIHVYKMFN